MSDEEDGEYEYHSDGEEYDEGSEVGGLTPTTPPRSGRLKELKVPDGSYILTCFEDITPYRDSLIHEVSNLLDVDEDCAQQLLQHFRWEKEKLVDAFFSGSQEKVMLDCGMDLYSSDVAMSFKSSAPSSSSIPSSSSSSSSDPVCSDCRICYDPSDLSPGSMLGCKHLFHNNCYRDYLINEVSQGPTCIIAHCPEIKCKQRVLRQLYAKLLPPAELERYDRYVMRSFIEDSKTLKYCPAAGCDRVAVGSGISTIKCQCQRPFCFRCGEEAHEPVTCAQLSVWALKCSNESETANWILVNTKQCPACQSRIEKNQGCNHIVCGKCKFHFCWICMGPWSEHNGDTGGFYKCNRYDASKTDGSSKYTLALNLLFHISFSSSVWLCRLQQLLTLPSNPSHPTPGKTQAERARAELERYLHYYQRFHGHDSSLKFAANQRASTERRMGEMQEAQKSPLLDVECLRAANEQIIECRRVLKYTYVLGFFLEDNTPEKQLFEHQQEMLEKNTESLHRCAPFSFPVQPTSLPLSLPPSLTLFPLSRPPQELRGLRSR